LTASLFLARNYAYDRLLSARDSYTIHDSKNRTVSRLHLTQTFSGEMVGMGWVVPMTKDDGDE
jgi:hypothetical protein